MIWIETQLGISGEKNLACCGRDFLKEEGMTELKCRGGEWSLGDRARMGEIVKQATKCELLFPPQTDGEPKCE